MYLILNFHRTKFLQNVTMCTAFMLDDRPFIFVFCVNVSCLKMSWAKNRGSNDIERPKDNKRKSFLCHLFCTTLQLLFTQLTAGLTSRVILRFEFHVPHQILYTTLDSDENVLRKWNDQMTSSDQKITNENLSYVTYSAQPCNCCLRLS